MVLSPCVGISFPVAFNEYGFILFKYVVIWPLVNPIALYVLCRESTQSFCHGKRGVGALRPIVLHQLLGLSTGHGGPMSTIGANLALSLLYVSKVLFCPVLGCVVVSLVTPTLRCNGQVCVESPPLIDNLCTVLCWHSVIWFCQLTVLHFWIPLGNCQKLT